MTFRKIPLHAFGNKSILKIRDISAITHNYQLYKSKVTKVGSDCAVVLKGDVHGLGMAEVAPALYKAGVRTFFIEELIEGITLREILKDKEAKIYAMAGLLINEEVHFANNNIIPCLTCLEQLNRWNQYCTDNRRSAVIHFDTHMNRLGLLDKEVEILSKNFQSLTSNLNIEFYMSHLFDIKGNDHTNCYYQLNIFKQYLSRLPKRPVSFACTDGVILLKNEDFNFDQVRIGIGLVGGAPNANSCISHDFKHTIEIYTKISQLKTVPAGSKIGYGGSYTVKRDTKLVLAHIGYKDGYLRLLSKTDAGNLDSGGFMYIGGYRAPVIGKISLGISTLDVTDIPDHILEEYHYAEVVGPNVDIRVLADLVGCYEILIALGRPNIKVADYTLQEYKKLFPQESSM